jgi:hypothetical protein
VSEGSPATGNGPDRGKGRQGKGTRKRTNASEPASAPLHHARWRHLSWAVALIALGIVLIVKVGAVGKAIGLVALLFALREGWLFACTLLYPPGQIEVDADHVTLPRGLCRPNPVTLPVTQVQHAFFLRRTVPWTTTGPVLVVETELETFSYPRDWFATDSDQRRIVTALNHRLGRL